MFNHRIILGLHQNCQYCPLVIRCWTLHPFICLLSISCVTPQTCSCQNWSSPNILTYLHTSWSNMFLDMVSPSHFPLLLCGAKQSFFMKWKESTKKMVPEEICPKKKSCKKLEKKCWIWVHKIRIFSRIYFTMIMFSSDLSGFQVVVNIQI